MKLTFVRHGETEYNKEGRIMSRKDIPLDERGIEQSKRLAEKLPVNKFSKICHSPLKRAQMTAEIINEKLNIDIFPHPELIERDFGSLCGKTWFEMQEEAGVDLLPDDNNQTYNYHPYGGESVEDVKARLDNFLNDMREEDQNQDILVVTHTGIIRLMYTHYLKQDGYPAIDNDSTHEFELN